MNGFFFHFQQEQESHKRRQKTTAHEEKACYCHDEDNDQEEKGSAFFVVQLDKGSCAHDMYTDLFLHSFICIINNQWKTLQYEHLSFVDFLVTPTS